MIARMLQPRYWLGHLAVIACIGVSLGLGLWQYDAWQQRRADAARDLTNEAPTPLDSVMGGDSPFPGRSLGHPVEFSGTWLDPTLYVSDRGLDGRVGYWVVTPVLVEDSAMPVVRGWSATPDAPSPNGPVDVVGWLQATEAVGASDEDPTDDVITSMRIASIVEHVDADLYSGYVVARDLTPAPTDALAAVTPEAVPPVSGFTALRNLFYAIEWWVFGAFAVFVWVRWCRDCLEELTGRPVASGS